MTLGSLLSTLASPYRMQSARITHEDDQGAQAGAVLVAADGRELPLVASTLRVEAGGGIARAVLEQTFVNRHPETLRVTYRMPLPADGAVSGYEFEIGGRVVRGRVDPKAAARAKFEEAIARGQTAALLEQQRDDVFTQEIGNVPAQATIVARVTVDQRLAWLPEGEWELRFPTVIGPRYAGTTETEVDARDVHVETSEAPLGVRVALDVHVLDDLAPGVAIASPSHALAAFGGRARLRAPEGARLDRDVVVRWRVAKPSVGVSLRAGRMGERAFGLLTIVPPAPGALAGPRIPRDLIVLLDTSGSMGGAPLAQAQRVVALLLDSLSEIDRFEVIEFGTRPNRYAAGPLAADASAKRDAIRWVMARKADGGTEMHTAVAEALRPLRPGAQRQVVLVTDGYIGGERQIVELCHERLPDSCRLHVIGVGAAANRSLSGALARAGRGAEVLVGLDEDAERAAARLLARTESPILTDVRIEGAAIVARAPEHAPDVFAGAPLVVALELSPAGGEILVRGAVAGGQWQERVRVPAIGEGGEGGEGSAAVAALFGRERVADLETRWTLGRDAAAIDREIEAIGTGFQIATRMTSWVAVDPQPAVNPYAPSRVEVVPQELPYGTTAASFGLARGALGAPAPPMSFAMPAAAPMPAMLAAPAPGYGLSTKARSSGRLEAMSGAPTSTLVTVGQRKARRRALFPVLLGLLVAVVVALAIAALVWFLSR